MRSEGLKRRSIAVRYLTLSGGEAFSKICAFATFAYLARALDPRDFGLVELSLAVTGLFVLGTELGLGSYGARLIEQAPGEAAVLVPRVAVLRALLAVPAYLALLFVSERAGMPGLEILSAFGLVVLLTPFFTQWVFQGLRQMQWVAVASSLRYAVFAAMVLLLVRSGSDPRWVALAEVSGAVAVVVFNFVVVLRILRIRLDWRDALSGARDLAKKAWYLGASDMAWFVIWYAPSVVTGWLLAERIEEVAWLAAAVRIVMALHTFVWLYFFNLLPNLTRELHNGLGGWRDLVERSVPGSTWIACLIALSGTLFAPVVVATAYGDAFRAAVLPLQIVLWMIPVAWLSGHFRYSLIAVGHQRLEFAASAAAGLLTVVVATVGAQAAGAAGAAAGLLAGGVANAVLAGIACFRAIGPIRLAATRAPLLACLGAGAIAAIGTRLGSSTVGVVLALLFFLGRAASRENLERFTRAWREHRD